MAAAAAIHFRNREIGSSTASSRLGALDGGTQSVAERLEGVLQSHKFFENPSQSAVFHNPTSHFRHGQHAAAQESQQPHVSHRTASNLSGMLKESHRTASNNSSGILKEESGKESLKKPSKDGEGLQGIDAEQQLDSERSQRSKKSFTRDQSTSNNAAQYRTRAVFMDESCEDDERGVSKRTRLSADTTVFTQATMSRWSRFRSSTFDPESTHHTFKGTARQVQVHKVVTSGFFEIAMGVAILANLIFITAEQSYRLEGRSFGMFDAAEHAFLTIYVLELLARFYIWGLACLRNNYVLLDFVIVLMGVIATWILKPAMGDVDGLGPMFMLRIARLIRLVRALRLLVIFRELWMLVAGLLNALRTMLYTLFLLMIILYAFGLVGLELLANHSLVHGETLDPEFKAIVDANFNDLPTAMLSLLQFVMFDNVVYIYKPLVTRDWTLMIFFGLVILVLGIVLMNLVTAVIVNSALEQANQDKDLTKSIEQARKKKLVKEMRKIFVRLDEDNSGDISREEIQNINAVDKEILRKLMGMNNPLEIFDALDVDGDEEIGIDEFVDGIWQVIISDTPIHVKRMEKQMAFLRQEVQDTQDLQLEFQQKMEEKLDLMIGLGKPYAGESSKLVSPMGNMVLMGGAPSVSSLESDTKWQMREQSLQSDTKWQMREQSLQNWQTKELSLAQAREKSLSTWVSASQHTVGHQGDPAQDGRGQLLQFPPRVDTGHVTAKHSLSNSSAENSSNNGFCADGSRGMSTTAPVWAVDLLTEVRALRSVTSKLTFRETMKERRKLVARGIRPPKVRTSSKSPDGDHPSRDGSSDEDSFNSRLECPRTPLTPSRNPFAGATSSTSSKSRFAQGIHSNGTGSEHRHNHSTDVREASRAAGKDSSDEGTDSVADVRGGKKDRSFENKSSLPPLLEQAQYSSSYATVDPENFSPNPLNYSSNTFASQTLMASLSSTGLEDDVPQGPSVDSSPQSRNRLAHSRSGGGSGSSPVRVESL
mmetsp:Transcript_15155/g.34518  ORF Transcript_15155/g.34518 Transcript_15155/m.34518 type:complete len:993 (-) Transcript_15155:52-3030(-)